MNAAHLKHLNVVVERHDAPDRRFRFPAQPATGTVNLDLLPWPQWPAVHTPPSAQRLACRLLQGGIESLPHQRIENSDQVSALVARLASSVAAAWSDHVR
jgi:hypothetical protein